MLRQFMIFGLCDTDDQAPDTQIGTLPVFVSLPLFGIPEAYLCPNIKNRLYG